MPNKIDLGSVTSYAMAVEAGFVGTEAEWVAALVGAGNQYTELSNKLSGTEQKVTDAEKTIGEHDDAIKENAEAIETLEKNTTEELGKRLKAELSEVLPEAGEADTVYLVPSEDASMLLIYLYKDNKWVQVGGAGTGDGTIDEEALSTALASYYTKTEVDNLLKSLDLSDFYTKDEVDELLETVPAAVDVEKNTTDIAELKEQLALVGVSIQSLEDEDGTVRQYLVSSTGERLGDAIVSTGGGGGSTATSIISVTMAEDNPSSVEIGKPCPISFWWTSVYPDGGSTGNGTIEFSVKSGTTTTRCASRTLGQATTDEDPITFDFGQWLRSGNNTIIIKITDSEGNSTSRRMTVTAQVLTLEVDYDWTTVNSGDAAVRWRVGGSSGVTMHATLANQPVATVNSPTVGRWQTLTIPHKEHGAYRLRLWTTLEMDDGSVITSSITGFDIIFADADITKVLIASDFSTEEPLQQYTAQSVNYFVYDPLAEQVDVTRLVDGEVYAEDEAVERLMQEWKWKPTESGQHAISIRAGLDENQTTRNFVVTVNGVDIPESVQEVATYALKFNPAGHQNSDTDPLAGICKDSAGNEIACTVNDGFDWTSGGIQYDELGNPYFCIMSGDRLTIDYAPFAVDCKPTGRHIKICFNTTEVANRATPWLSCVDSAAAGNAVGLVMTPTSATISSEQNQSLSTRYMYDRNKYFDLPEIEMDINIQKSSQKRLIQYWMGGCPAQVIQYTADDGFAQNEASKLVIGSDECEVHLYLLKIAENSWEDEEITDDWIMNAPSGEEMVSRYQRNDIYATDGTLDFDKLPESLVKVVIHADQWTIGKDKANYITGTVDFYIDGKHGTAQCRFRGQGTSSMGYIDGGLNVDIDLLSEITWDDGTTTVGLALTENSIPITYMNYKVNIASSENYKNMLYAADFQEFNPYLRPARVANPNVRDTMEFRMAVMCFHNTNSDTVWAGSTEYAPGATALYAVGNLGNSKKNLEAMGEGVTDEYIDTECLVECDENTSGYHLMQDPVPDDDEVTFYSKGIAYAFRYPDGDETEAMKASFRRLQRWVVSTCTEPDKITGEALDEIYIVENGVVSYKLDSNGIAVTVYDSQSRPRKVVENCPYDTEQIEVDGVFYTVLPLDAEGNEVTGYSHDTEAYRLGKFLQEFDDYFIFDSIAYHYHVTHQFTMADNRAKNTFYGTEDGVHWHLVFAYDGDTQMGNNNSGDLTLDYGLEDIDILGGGYVFNGARHTLWVNMRKLYDKTSPYYNAEWYNRMRDSYQTAETAGAWDPIRRLNKIKAWVAMIPEVLWRDDARKKYMNPLYNSDNASYLAKCNGPLLDTTAQFIIENQPYFASMWQTAANREQLVTVRGYTPAEYPEGYTPSSAVTLTAFAKCYLSVDYDGDLKQPVRLNPGESATFDQGDVKLNDTPVYIPGAQLISSMSTLSRMYPGFCDFNKLVNCQRIEVGEGGDYRNQNLKTLVVGGCKKMRHLDIRNTSALTGTLDVSNSRELRTVYGQGSGVSGVSFAPGGRLQEYYGGSNVASIVAKTLRDVETFELEAYDSVTRVNIEQSPGIHTDVIMQKSSNVTRVRLTGINWNLTSTELLHRIHNLIGLDASGNDTEKAVLTGYVHLNQAKESELAKFASAWPLLEIECDMPIKEFTVTYMDADQSTVLHEEIYADGDAWVDPVAAGTIDVPQKAPEDRTGFTYAGWDQEPATITENLILIARYDTYPIVLVSWYQNDGVTLIYQKFVPSGWEYVDPVTTGEIGTPTIEPSVEYEYTYTGWDSTPTTVSEDIKVFATYSRSARKYTVRWHNYGGTTLYEETTLAHGSVEYPGDLNMTRPSHDNVQYLWLGEWDQDTTDVVCDMDCYPVFMECVLPKVTTVPTGWYIYSDNPDDNMVYTKSEFAAIMLSDLTTIKQYLAVGDKIKIALSTHVIGDTELIYQLNGFKHHRIADESNEFAATTWFPIGLLDTVKMMNDERTNNGGWAEMELRDWLNDTLYPELPVFWRCLIKKVKVLARVGGTSGQVATSEDYLYLISYAEAGFGTTDQLYLGEIDADAENITYSLYTDDNSRIKKKSNGEGESLIWWLRSPKGTSSSEFHVINNVGGGGTYYYTVTYEYGIAPGFSI
ncbi:MAG: hypothetical protein IKJ99_03400 [Oscillospiraceae bacterium]|nr:hypothetical protein [Oscillospiraceae bacterium]